MNNVTIVFAGAYGIENTGDDLPLIVLCENLKASNPNIDFNFHVFSRHPNEWEEQQYGVKMIKNLEYESREASAGKWFNGLNFGDDKVNLIKVRNAIKNADMLVFGAGNFLIDISIDLFRGQIPLLATYIFLAKLYNKPVLLYGISAGPIKTQWGKDLTKWIVENVDIVTVRDSLSKELIKNITKTNKDIHVLPDTTFGVNISKSEAGIFSEIKNYPNTKKPLVAIGLRDLTVVLSQKKAENSWKEIASFINSLKHDYEFIFVPQSTYFADDDRITATKFIKLLDNDVVYHKIKNRYNPKELISLYGKCFCTLSIRLHSAIFSVIAGTPILSINYLSKVDGFMKEMDLEDYIVDINNISKQEILKKFFAIKDNYTGLKEKVEFNRDNMRNQAKKYVEFALELLKK